MSPVDPATLEGLRKRTDPEADRVAEHYLDRPPSDFFSGVLAARSMGTDMQDPHVAAWLKEQPPLPDWVDRGRLSRGSGFFAEWGVELGLGLFLSSLPLAYAAHDGVQVLALTAQLETDTKRRILESAQFVLDVTAPGALEPGRPGYETARLVRLMHAGVRHLIRNDPRVARTSDPSVWPRWDESWGEPINQEHLLGAMISYSSSLLHVLDRLRIDYDAQRGERLLPPVERRGLAPRDRTRPPAPRAGRDGRDRGAHHQAQPEAERGGHEDDGRADRLGGVVHRHQAAAGRRGLDVAALHR